MARRTLKQVPLEQPFVVKGSRIAGKGAFATRDITKGERIIEYLGERISHAVSDARYDDHSGPAHHTFLFNVNRSVVIDAYVKGNAARFINHSCDPNCESEIERGRVFIDAIRPIKKGEELAYDYAYGRDGTETKTSCTDAGAAQRSAADQFWNRSPRPSGRASWPRPSARTTRSTRRRAPPTRTSDWRGWAWAAAAHRTLSRSISRARWLRPAASRGPIRRGDPRPR